MFSDCTITTSAARQKTDLASLSHVEMTHALSLTEFQLPEISTANFLSHTEIWSHHKHARWCRRTGGSRVSTPPLGHFTASRWPLALFFSLVIHNSSAGGAEIQRNQARAHTKSSGWEKAHGTTVCWHHGRCACHGCQAEGWHPIDIHTGGGKRR